AAVPLGDHHALVGLLALLVAFNDGHLDDHRIPGRELGNLAVEALDFFLLELPDQIHCHFPHVSMQSRRIGCMRFVVTAAPAAPAARDDTPREAVRLPSKASGLPANRAGAPTCGPAPASGASGQSPRGCRT